MKTWSFKSAHRALVLLIIVLCAAKASTATSAILLTDEQLITSSRVILLGDVLSTRAQWDPSHTSINTYVKVHVSRLLKGQLQGEQIVFKQLGGTVGNESTHIFGAPAYKAADRVLLFLDTAPDGTLRVAHLFMGKYDIVDDPQTNESRVERNIDKGSVNILGVQEGPDITNTATLARFTKKIRKVLRTNTADVAGYDAKYAAVPIVETPPEYIDNQNDESQPDLSAQYALFGYRWFEPDSHQPVIYRVNQTGAPIAGGGVNEINQALAAWTNVQTTSLVLQNGGSTTAFGFRQDGVTAISFNDPLNEMTDPVGCSGILAIGGYSSAGGPTVVIGGQTFGRIYEGDVVFNNNFQCFLGISANLAEVATHEIGHSIGFDHSADGAAIMYASAHGNGRGPTLGSDDIAAVSFLYPGSKSTVVAPNAPSNLTATTASSSTINLTWTDNSNNEDGFRLERKTGAGGTYALIATLPAGQTGYSNSGLSASTIYFYRIRAYNSAGNSNYSNEASASTPAGTGDTDGDGIPDVVEQTLGKNPLVKDNDVFTSAQLFAMQQYRDFLGREGDSGGISYWTNRINSGSATRAQVVDSFFNSAEFQGTVSPVTRLYFAYFLRIPDYAGLSFWVNQYRQGATLDSISQAFAGSSEFQATYGSLNNTQFVTLVYQNVLGRAPDSGGLAFWVGRLNSGSATRGSVMLGFSESAEYKQSSYNKVYVTMIYVGMLKRAPDQAGFNFWVGQMNSGGSGLNLIQGFLNASEYRSRFLP